MPRLGALFLTAALGPIHHAARCMMARQVDAGLGELSRESLMGAFDRGITTVAGTVGLPPRAVRQLLPMAHVETALEAIGAAQHTAFSEWRRHTGHAGGLLMGIADLTEDGRPPDASLCVLRLAKKMRLDKELSEPLEKLSEQIDQWQLLMDHCRTLLDNQTGLEASFRRRRVLRMAALATTVLGTLGAMLFIHSMWASRQRVTALLRAPDPCAIEALDPGDEGRASGEQRAMIDERKRACSEQREAERRRAEQQRLAEAARRAAEQRKEELLDRCDSLGRHLEANALSGDDLRHAAAHAPLMRRIAAGVLEGGDVSRDPGTLPCHDTPGGKRITRAFARAVVASAPGWVLVEAPSVPVRKILAAHKADIDDDSWLHFVGHVEQVAKRAVVGGGDERLAHARKLCDTVAAIGLEEKAQCQATRLLAERAKLAQGDR